MAANVPNTQSFNMGISYLTDFPTGAITTPNLPHRKVDFYAK